MKSLIIALLVFMSAFTGKPSATLTVSCTDCALGGTVSFVATGLKPGADLAAEIWMPNLPGPYRIYPGSADKQGNASFSIEPTTANTYTLKLYEIKGRTWNYKAEVTYTVQ